MIYIGVLVSNGNVVFARELGGDLAKDKVGPDALAAAQDKLDAVRQADEFWSYYEGDTCQIWADGHPLAFYDGEAEAWTVLLEEPTAVYG